MSYLVTIELEFGAPPSQTDVQTYLTELIDDGFIVYKSAEIKTHKETLLTELGVALSQPVS